MTTGAECLSLCEIEPRKGLAYLHKHQTCGGDGAHDIAQLKTKRLYLGSSFCPRFFATWSSEDILRSLDLMSNYAQDVRITLVIPIATESQVEGTIEHAEQLISESSGAIDEISVNDYGMFSYWGNRIEQGAHLALNLGRLLNKNPRDPRVELLFETPHTPSLITPDWRGFTNLDRLEATHPVKCVELDPTHRTLDLSQVPDHIEVAVHEPFCYQSTGQICEFASIDTDVELKFRPNMRCSLQCQRTSISYKGDSGVEFFKVGRTVYFRNEFVTIIGNPRLRRIITPLEEVLI